MEEGFEPQPSDRELWREVNALKSRVGQLEAALKTAGASPAPPPPLNPVSRTDPSLPSPPEASNPSPAAPTLDRSGQPSALEARIGAQVFNRIGVFAVLAGSAWFLKLAIDRAWIGPGVRVAVGLFVSVGLVLWSERFRRNGAVAFSNTLKALGSGIAYLSLWASVNLYQLVPDSAGFVAMVAVTATNAALAWWRNSELLAALALAGGLATPALLSYGGDRELFLFSYLLLLDVAILVLIALRPWPRLAVAAFAGTTIYFAEWWLRFYSRPDEALTGTFIALFFAVFTLVPMLALRRKTSAAVNGLLIGLPVAVGLCAFLESYQLFASGSLQAERWWIALVLGAIYLGLTVFSGAAAVPSTHLAKPLRNVHLSLAIGFFALAGWLRFHGYGIALTWLAELVVVAVVATRLQAGELAKPLRANVLALLLLSFCSLLLLDVFDHQPSGTSALLNSHFAVYLVGLAAFMTVAITRKSKLNAPSLSDISLEVESSSFLAGFSTIAFNVIALLAVGLQIELYWHRELYLAQGGVNAFRHPAYVDFTYSAWFMLYGAALMTAGFLKRSAFLRWQALVLLSVSIAKVFLFDVSHLNEGYRVFSFLGLGVLLLAISFAYQRDWLALRGKVR